MKQTEQCKQTHRNRTGEFFAMPVEGWVQGAVDRQKMRRLFTDIFGN